MESLAKISSSKSTLLYELADCGLLCFAGEVSAPVSLDNITNLPGKYIPSTCTQAHTRLLILAPSFTNGNGCTR